MTILKVSLTYCVDNSQNDMTSTLWIMSDEEDENAVHRLYVSIVQPDIGIPMACVDRSLGLDAYLTILLGNNQVNSNSGDIMVTRCDIEYVGVDVSYQLVPSTSIGSSVSKIIALDDAPKRDVWKLHDVIRHITTMMRVVNIKVPKCYTVSHAPESVSPSTVLHDAIQVERDSVSLYRDICVLWKDIKDMGGHTVSFGLPQRLEKIRQLLIEHTHIGS